MLIYPLRLRWCFDALGNGLWRVCSCNKLAACEIIDPNTAGYTLWDCNVAVRDVFRSIDIEMNVLADFYIFEFSFQYLLRVESRLQEL